LLPEKARVITRVITAPKRFSGIYFY